MVNFFTPLALGRLVEDLSQGASPWADVAIYAFLKMLQGQGSLLTVMQNVLWVPVEQYSDRMMSMMAFEHLLNLSMSFHTKKKTGEVLRILDRGTAHQQLFQYLLFNLLPVFIDIFVAMIYMTRPSAPPSASRSSSSWSPTPGQACSSPPGVPCRCLARHE